MKIVFLIFLFIVQLYSKNLETWNKYDDVFQKYEKEYGISYFLMKSIAMTENKGFNEKAIMKNTNGTIDIGLMQVNSKWIEWMPEANITKEKLKDPEFNIKVGFMIVSKIIREHGYSWHSIGRYHSGTPQYKAVWLKRIKENIKTLAELDERVVIVGQK